MKQIIQKHSHHLWFVHKTLKIIPAKSYVDSQISNAYYLKLDGSNFMTVPLNMDENRIENIVDPQNEQDAVNRQYLESQLFEYLKLNGSTPMTYHLNMANYRIINTGNPQGGKDSLNKEYVDNDLLKKLNISGGVYGTTQYE